MIPTWISAAVAAGLLATRKWQRAASAYGSPMTANLELSGKPIPPKDGCVHTSRMASDVSSGRGGRFRFNSINRLLRCVVVVMGDDGGED